MLNHPRLHSRHHLQAGLLKPQGSCAVRQAGRGGAVAEPKLNTHMNLLNPDCVKGRRSGSRWSGDEGQDDGGPQASHRGALAPSPPGPPSAPYWLHHDSRWYWAGRARCLRTRKDRRINRRQTGPPHTQPAPACLAPSHTLGPGPGGLLPPRPDLSRKRATGRVREGPGRWVVVSHQEQIRRTAVANPFSCPLLALEGLPGAGWQCRPQAWPLGLWRHPLR